MTGLPLVFFAIALCAALAATIDTTRWMTPPEVADRLGVAPEKVLSWIKRGMLRASNVGDGTLRPRWRIDPADLDEFLRSRQPAPRQPIQRRRRKDDNVIEFFK